MKLAVAQNLIDFCGAAGSGIRVDLGSGGEGGLGPDDPETGLGIWLRFSKTAGDGRHGRAVPGPAALPAGPVDPRGE
jgi:hypothetical protein